MPLPVAPDPITVWWDTAQRRVVRPASRFLVLSELGGGTDWDPASCNDDTGTWLCPIRNVVTLRPMCLEEAWGETGSGRFARYQKSQYSFATGAAASYEDYDAYGGFDTWLFCQSGSFADDAPGRTVVTGSALAANQGVFLAWVNYGGGIQDWIQMECGWGGSDHEAADVAVRFWAGGRVEVWFHGRLAQVESLNLAGGGGERKENETVGVILMPWRAVELLVYGVSSGGGFSAPMPVADDYGPIVAAKPFWWRVPRGQVMVQFAPLQFPSSGTVRSLKNRFAFAPGTGLSLDPAYSTALYDRVGGAGEATGQVLDLDGAPFMPDGEAADYVIEVELTGGGNLTPQLWGARGQFAGVLDETDDADEFEITDWVTALSLTVPEEPDGAEVVLTVRDPLDLADSGGPDFAGPSSAAVQLRAGSVVLFDGVSDPAEWTAGRGGNPAADRAEVRVRDRWKLLESSLFTEPACLDAMYLHEAFEILLDAAGVPHAERDLSDVEAERFWLRPSGSTPALLIAVGDSVADWVKRLWEAYLPTWFLSWRPQASGTPKFTVANPLRDVAARATVYSAISEAVTGLQADALFGYTEAEAQDAAPYHVRRSFQVGAIEPEANEIHVLGWDPRRDLPVSYRFANADSQDPRLARSARPANWLGRPVVYGYADKLIRDGASAMRALTLLYDRLTPRRWAGEMRSDLLWEAADEAPLWLGRCASLDGDVFRVTGLHLQSRSEADPATSPGAPARDVEYLLEYVSGATWTEPPPSQFQAWRDEVSSEFVTVDGGF